MPLHTPIEQWLPLEFANLASTHTATWSVIFATTMSAHPRHPLPPQLIIHTRALLRHIPRSVIDLLVDVEYTEARGRFAV